MRSRSRQTAWLQKALCFVLVAGVVTAAGAGGDWSNVRSITFTSNAADPTGTPPDLIHVSSFEAGEMPGPVFCDGAFGDRDGDGLRDLACVTEFVPADPVSVAPPLDPTVPANYYDATIFIYEGVNPIQRGVRPGTIVDYRATVMRGLVRDDQGQPLPGVLVRILDHPELGYTYTRGDGMFDMAVNGGGDIVVHYSKDGYLRAQRRIDTPWNDWRWVDDATLVPLDTSMTVVPTTGTQGSVVARATTVTDADGSRRATAFFPAGTQAWLKFANGSTQAAPQLSFRATEYTVGDNGRDRMPAALPPSTAYTYAIELSADEAIAAGAQSVEFSQPVAMYLENFLEFPVGTVVPVGSYSFRQASWNPEDDGRVIKILSVSGGIASIDIDGSGSAASDADLLELGITAAERNALAITYTAGTELWRYRAIHFSPWDCNQPYEPDPQDTPPPENPPEDPNDPPAEGPPTPGDPPDPNDPCSGAHCSNDPNRPHDDKPQPPEERDIECGSILDCNSQTLGERMRVPGTDLSLNYESSRVPASLGGTAGLDTRVRMTEASLPRRLERAELQFQALGHRREINLSPLVADHVQPVQLSLRDAYQREWLGAVPTSYRLSYTYPTRLSAPSATFESRTRAWERFGQPGLALSPDYLSSSTRNYVVSRSWSSSARALSVGGRLAADFWDARGQGFGGWTLGDHHVFDAASMQTHMGDGRRLRAISAGDQVPQTTKLLMKQIGPAAIPGARRIATAPDGAVFMLVDLLGSEGLPVSDGLVRMRADGTREDWGDLCAIPDTDCLGPESEYVPAARDLAVDSRGHVYLTEGTRIVRFTGPDAYTIVVEQAGFPQPCEVQRLVARQQRIFFSCAHIPEPGRAGRISKRGESEGWVGTLWPNGAIALIAGGGTVAADGVAAEALQLLQPTELAVDFGGNLFVYDQASLILWRVRENGAVESVLGNGSPSFTPDGSVAKSSPVGRIRSLAHSADNRIMYAEMESHRIREIRPDGRIYTIAGGGNQAVQSLTDVGDVARQLSLDTNDIDVLPEGTVAFMYSDGVGSPSYLGAVVNSSFASYRGYGGDSNEFSVPSRDGSEVFIFSSRGRHLETRHGLTGAVIRQFQYNPTGYITAIDDGDGNRTLVERAPDNRPTAIVNPDGVRTDLVVSPGGYLTSLTSPTNEAWAVDYHPNGLMRSFEDPRGGRSEFSWTIGGLLARDQNALGDSTTLQNQPYAAASSRQALTRSPEGRQSEYSLNRSEPGALTRHAVTRAGIRTSRGLAQDGDEIVEHGHGVRVTSRTQADPRFGAGSPFVVSRTTQLPFLGTTRSESFQRTATPTVPNGGIGTLDLEDTQTVNGRIYRRRYNSQARTWTTTSPAGRTAAIAVDGQGRPLSIALPNLAPVMYAYDARGRLIRISAEGSGQTRVTEFAYDDRGYLGSVRDAESREVILTNDASGRTTAQRLPDARSIGFRYDASSNVVGITPPGRAEHRFSYNALQRLTRYTPPGGGASETAYGYDRDKLTTSVSRPGGDNIALTYGTGLTVLSRIAGPLRTIDYDLDGYGRITRAAPLGSWQTTWNWNGMLPRSQSVAVAGNAGPVNRFVSWTYDNNFWLSGIQIGVQAQGLGTTYLYDADGLLTRATTGSAVMILGRHTGNGLLTGTNLGLVLDTWTYNAFAEPVLYSATVAGSSYYSQGFGRDRLGRITRKTDVVNNETQVFDYGYDLAGRLDTVRRNGALIADYGFDANSNRNSVTYAAPLAGQVAQCAPAPSNGVVTLTGTFDAQDRMTSYGTCRYTYAPDGELASRTDSATGAITTYVYDEFGNLRTVDLPDGRAIEYVTDGLNRRVGKKVGGVLVQGLLYSNQLEPVAELDGDGDVVATFVYADRGHVPSYMLKGGSVYRILADQLGSVRLVVDIASGAIAQRMDYDAFGNVIGDTAPGFQPFGYAGGIYDRDTGLSRFGARDYDPVTGRWTAKDPIRFDGEDANLYNYVGGSPVSFADPTGLWSMSISGYIPTVVGGPVGPGGGIVVAYDGRNFSLSFRAGIGAGGGVAFDPGGGPPDPAAPHGGNSLGTFADIGGAYGPIGFGATAKYGTTQFYDKHGRLRNQEYGFGDDSSKLKPRLRMGYGTSAACGVELTHYWGN